MVYTLTEASNALKEGKFRYSEATVNVEKNTRTMWVRDARGSNPEVLFESAFRQPFDLHQGKGKAIDPNKVLSLELSLNEQEHPQEVEYFQQYDTKYIEHLTNNKVDCFGKNIATEKIKFMLRPSLTPSEKTPGLYLLRTKVSKNTKIYIVTDYDGDIVTRYRKGTLADIFRGGGTLIPTITHLQGYTGTTAGSVHTVNKLLYFPYQKKERQPANENPFPFSQLKSISSTAVEEPTHDSEKNTAEETNQQDFTESNEMPATKRARK